MTANQIAEIYITITKLDLNICIDESDNFSRKIICTPSVFLLYIYTLQSKLQLADTPKGGQL